VLVTTRECRPLRFSPTDDATVDSSQPTVNADICSRFTADNSPELCFADVQRVPGGWMFISSAKLQLTVRVSAIEGRFQAAGLAQLSWTEGLTRLSRALVVAAP
jgi:hypothetical protein